MEIIRGKQALLFDASALVEHSSGYERVHIDIGTGDGYFVRHIAERHPTCLVIGVDACHETLREGSRRAAANTLFVIANAQTLPSALHGLATHVTINFPWGSLLEGLLRSESTVLAGLTMVMRPNAKIEVRLNGGALAEHGFGIRAPLTLSSQDLRLCPTTWAKRLAFGRDPRGTYLCGTRG